MARRGLIAAALLAFAAPAFAGGDAAHGRRIFEQICAHCHETTHEEKIGPGLADVLARVPEPKLDAWLANPPEMARKDPYFRRLRETNRWGMVMPRLPAMQDAQNRADVIAYLKTLR